MKNNTFLIEKESILYKRHKLFLGIYVVLCALFVLFSASCNVKIGEWGIFAICFVNVVGALDKCKRLNNAIVRERVYKSTGGIPIGLKSKDYMSIPTVLLCFVNYCIMSWTMLLVIELFFYGGNCRDAIWKESGFNIVLSLIVGFATFIYGNYLVYHSSSLFDKEPPLTDVEIELKERNNASVGYESRGQSTWDAYHYRKEKSSVPDYVWFILTFTLIVLFSSGTYRKYNSHDNERYDYLEYYDDGEEYHDYFN